MSKKSTFYFGTLFLLLSIFAFSSSLQLQDDSYQHWQTSTEIIQTFNWKQGTIDLWNKPIPTLIYGVPGRWGIEWARIISILLVLLTAGFLMDEVRRWKDLDLGFHGHLALGSLAFFVFQLSVLPQSFLTMTELPAAFILAFAFWIKRQNWHRSAFLMLGFLPLARVEASLLMAFCFVAWTFEWLQNFSDEDSRKKTWKNAKSWKTVFVFNLIGSLPFIIWWLLGWHFTHHPVWILEQSYAYLRPFHLLDILTINAFFGLPSVLSGPLLWWFCWGLLSGMKHPRGYRVVMGGLLIHLFFLSAFVVYPQGSGFGDSAVGAINPRNFNVVSPWIALLVWLGVSQFCRCYSSGPTDNPHLKNISNYENTRYGIWSLGLSLLLIGGYAIMQYRLGSSFPKAMGRLVVQAGWIGLLGFLLLQKKRIRPLICPSKCFVLLASIAILSGLTAQPLFWYPLRWQDHQAQNNQAFCEWYEHRYPKKIIAPPVIIQDLNGRLDRFCQISDVSMPWVWAAFFQKSIDASPEGSLLLVETDGRGNPAPRYSLELLKNLQSSSFKHLHDYRSKQSNSSFFYYLNQITNRNLSKGWIVYEKQTP